MKKKAIVYLLNNNTKDILDFRCSIPLLLKNYLYYYKHDVVCFYENDFPESEINYLKSLYGNFLTFVRSELKKPEYPEEIENEIPEFFPHPDFPNSRGFPMGYRNMCRLFSGEIFKKSILEEYSYIWRLDTDSYILAPITEDVFDSMEQAKSPYGFVNIQNDHPGTCLGLWDKCAEYFKEINPTAFSEENKAKMGRKVFYTNFEIFDMEFFRSEEYMDFYNFIDESGGIYTKRWGDHIIRFMAMYGLKKIQDCLFFKDIHYYHSDFYHDKMTTDNF